MINSIELSVFRTPLYNHLYNFNHDKKTHCYGALQGAVLYFHNMDLGALQGARVNNLMTGLVLIRMLMRTLEP